VSLHHILCSKIDLFPSISELTLTALGFFEIDPPGGGDHYLTAAGCHNSGYLVTYTRDPGDPSIYGDIYGRMLLEPWVVNPGLWLLLLGN